MGEDDVFDLGFGKASAWLLAVPSFVQMRSALHDPEYTKDDIADDENGNSCPKGHSEGFRNGNS